METKFTSPKKANAMTDINVEQRIKKYFLILLILLGWLSPKAQKVSNLTVSGTGVKWYAAATGGTALLASTPLVNGTTYYASQTVNGVESSVRMAVTATVVTQAAPTAASHTPSQTQIVWNWNAATGATGYRWSTSNDYEEANNYWNVLTITETGLTCNTAYTRYIWAYNASGCVSAPTTLTRTTSSCVTTPTVLSSAASSTGATSTTLNGNVSSTGGATVTVRGFKYSTSNGFNPATTGTNISESGSYSTGAFNLTPTGLVSSTTYYAVAYVTNSIGTTYGNQVSFTTTMQTDFGYTGDFQSFVVPATGNYKLEVWGAQGGDASPYYGGMGGYASGTIALTAGQTIYIYVGQVGQGAGGGSAWNGGGGGTCCGAGGGGGTDFRLGGTALANRVIVAGAGGGGSNDTPQGNGGDGGGSSGLYGTVGAPGTQSSGYSLGVGETNSSDAAGGGGGYWGGYNGGGGTGGSGGGGSAYTGGVTSGTMIAGNASMPNPSGGNITGHSGNGYARITPVVL